MDTGYQKEQIIKELLKKTFWWEPKETIELFLRLELIIEGLEEEGYLK